MADTEKNQPVDALPPLNFRADVELGRLLDTHRAAKIDHTVEYGESEHGKTRKALMRYLNDAAQAYARTAVEADRARQQDMSGRDSALRAEPAGAYAQPLPMSSAPRDGTEVLAWSATGKTWHQVYWKTQEHGNWKWLKPFPPFWACRWNEQYVQSQHDFSYWLPLPAAPTKD